MSATRTRDPRGFAGIRKMRLDDPLVAGLLCLAVFAFALPWQSRWGLVADTSWIVTVAERVLAGERLYTDILETNPPFTIWLYLPAVALAAALNMASDPFVYGYVYLLCVAGFGFAGYLVNRAGMAQRRLLLALSPVLLALLVILPGNAFSQREHVAVALLLPLLVLTAWRADLEIEDRPTFVMAAIAGLLGSVIVLVKPYYVVIVLATACYAAWRRRNILVLFAPEYWVAALSVLAYLAAVIAFHPEFIRELYPLLSDTYLRVKGINTLFMAYVLWLAVWAAVLFLARPRGEKFSPLVVVLAIASASAYLPLFYQGKGWPYHAYPAIMLGLGAVLCQVYASVRPMGRGGRRVLLFMLAYCATVPFMKTQHPGAQVVTSLRSATDKPIVAMLGSDIAVGHPLNRLIGGTWLSPYCSDWLGSMAVYLSNLAARDNDDAAADRYAALAQDYADGKMTELHKHLPDVLLVQVKDRLWIDYMSQREDFAAFWQGYRLLAEDGTIAAYIRAPAENKAATPESPAAASG